MKIPQTTSFIAHEPQPSKIRVFPTNETNKLGKIPSLCSFGSLSPEPTCKCPQVLIADDDNFQHFYYTTLFYKSFSSNDSSIKEGSIKIQLCYSGEELLDRLAKILNCGCGKLILAIIDYEMGQENINGVETCLAIRKKGYDGFTLLRTSETRENLKRNHENLDMLFEEKVISAFVDKSELAKSKEIIRHVLNT